MSSCRTVLTLLIVAMVSLASAAPPEGPVALWPNLPPEESESSYGSEQETHDPKRPTTRIADVTKPSITVYPPSGEVSNTGAAVVVCPGGGYNILAYGHEGTDVAKWLNSIGVTAILLKYRVPRREGRPKHRAPLQDAQRAMSLARSNAEGWGIDPERIGILGFSAGGHLSAAASTNFKTRQYEPRDDADKISCRPDFTVLVYPAYMLEGEKLVAELPVDAETPPAFMVHAGDDKHLAEGSVAYYLALRKHDVSGELHVFPGGGHGFGMLPSAHPVSAWPQQCAAWMRATGILGAEEAEGR